MMEPDHLGPMTQEFALTESIHPTEEKLMRYLVRSMRALGHGSLELEIKVAAGYPVMLTIERSREQVKLT